MKRQRINRGSLGIVGMALAIALSIGAYSTHHANAAFDSQVDFSISTAGCDSSGTPTATCTEPLGSTFAVAVLLNHLPSNGSYEAYDATLRYTSGLATGPAGLTQTGAGNWPDCVFAASNFTTTPGTVLTGCSIGIAAPSSTYTGALLHLDFSCGHTPSTETITLVHGDQITDTVFFNGVDFLAYSENADESLTINCVGAVGQGCPNGSSANGAAHANERSAHGVAKQTERGC